MTQDERRAIEIDCARLAVAYAVTVDTGRYDEFAALFADDGELAVTRGTFKGPAAIKAAMEGRDPAVITRHVMTNVLVTVESPSAASGTAYLTLYKGAPPAGKKVVAGAAAQSVGQYHDRYVKTAHGWRIARREVVWQFA
jgi:3-phenylpropionate/cinnamic acid dioxygenase small subunit